MVRGRIKRIDVSDIILVVIFPVFPRHFSPPPRKSAPADRFLFSLPDAAGKQLSLSSRVFISSKVFTRFISIIWEKWTNFIPAAGKKKKKAVDFSTKIS